MKRILKPLVWMVAGVYFLLDAVLLPVAALISQWIGEHRMFCSLRRWIVSLRPYPTLLLFAIPLIVLEPVKPLAVYWISTGHARAAVTAVIAAELLKLVLIERLFHVSRDKLMSIPAFAWGYGKYRWARNWLESLEAWQQMRRLVRVALYTGRRCIREWRAASRPRRLSSQSR